MKKKCTHLLQTIFGVLSKHDKGFQTLVCVIDIFSKYTCTFSMIGNKGIAITNAFQKILDGSDCKPRKTWIN